MKLVLNRLKRLPEVCRMAPRFVVTATALLVLSSDLAHALDPEKSLTQYTQTVWATEQGLPSNSVVAIAQTTEGYLWIGTEEGLARFDGVRFTIFDKKNTPALQSNHVSALSTASDGTLWIGTQGGGLTKYRDGKFVTYTTREGLGNDVVLSLYEDTKGALWVGTNGGGLQRFKNGKFTRYTTSDGLPTEAIFSLSGGKDGSLWIGTRAGLGRFKDGRFATYSTKDGLPDNYVRCVYVDPAGAVWVGTNEGGVSKFENGHFTSYTTRNGLSNNTIWSILRDRAGSIWIGTDAGGLNRLDDGAMTHYSVEDGLPVDTVMTVFEDRESNLWVGTRGGGLVRLKDSPFTVFTSRQGLSGDVVLPVFQDHAGVIWVGTNGKGLNCLKDGKVIRTYSKKEGLSDDVILAIAEDHEGSMWIATRKGLDRLKNARLTRLTTADGLPTDLVLSLYTDHQGVLWAGTRAGLCRFDGRAFITYTTKDGLSNDYAIAIYEDRQNTLWIGTGGGGLNKFENGRFTSFTKRNGLSSDSIWSVTGDQDGTLWIGTAGGGLDRFKNGKFTVYTVREGLFDDELFAVLDDHEGNLWMSSNRGIFRVPKSQLNAYAEGRLKSITADAYDTSDGLKTKECNGGFQPAAWRTKDGRLLFPTMKGLTVVDPKRLGRNMLPAPVVIEQATVDGVSFDANQPIRAKPGPGRLEFEFTALSFVSPERLRFKYRLDNFDRDWTDAGTRRVAYYTNVPPGDYKFTVVARNDNGVWNKTGDSVALVIAPHYYQSRPFLALCVALAAGLCLGFYRLRIKHLKANEKRLLVLVDQRTQALQEEVNAKERAHAELAQAQQHLMELSRLSGRAEVASGVLHNVGNVLNSMNIGASVMLRKARDLNIANLTAAIGILREHSHDLSRFVETDVRGQRVLPYLANAAADIESERQEIVNEAKALAHHIDHVKQIVLTHQDYAKAAALLETVPPSKMVEDALRMVESSLIRHSIDVKLEIEELPEISVSKHKVLEILVNLLRNAKQAVCERNGPQREIRIRAVRHSADRIRMEVHDSGVGLEPENLKRIFAHGFTTKSNGHGFGLHSSAIAAQQMHGSLWAESDGPGRGARFILELPVQSVWAAETVTT
jgi:ligand-binding sensor domain-containing protein/signal transduction histidine kinase